MYSKMHQELYAYKLEIDIRETKCPVCNRYHLRMSQSGIITCKCGFLCDNTHPYVAGVKLDNDLDFHINKIKPGDEKNE